MKGGAQSDFRSSKVGLTTVVIRRWYAGSVSRHFETDALDRCRERNSGQVEKMESASLFQEKPQSERRVLTVFKASMTAREEASWRELFEGFDSLRAITYSSGLDLILELSEIFRDMEITFGSERILSREHAALEQASHVARDSKGEPVVISQGSKSALVGGEGKITSMAVLADGRLASAGADGIQLWPTDGKGEPIVLSEEVNSTRSLAVLADGRLASGGVDGTIKLWLVDEQQLIAALCLRAGSNLTKDEWTRYVGADTPRQPSCRDLPSNWRTPD
jgi:hypothetical protein